MGFGERLLDLLFPPQCAFCGTLTEKTDCGVCPACRSELPWTENLKRKADFTVGISAPLYYEGTVRQAMLRYKFSGAPARGEVYGRLIAERLRKEERTGFDVVAWAPLSRKRLRSRGYDQARLLAEAAAKELELSAEPLLRKVRHTPPQSGITTPEARRANVSGAYEALSPQRTEGKRILLIDDIITTGATVSECARVLLLTGAESVYAAALAVTRTDKKQSTARR